LCLAGKEFKQDAKDVVKIIVKLIRKEIQYNRIKVGRNEKKERNISCPMQEWE
jgi:hypothetical protein